MEGAKKMKFKNVRGKLSEQQREVFYDEMRSVVVNVEVYNNEYEVFDLEGAGVLISSQGHVLTLSHMLNDDESAGVRVVTFNKETIPCSVFKLDASMGLAILLVKSNNNQKFCFANLYSRELNSGNRVYPIGHPFYLEYSYPMGHISHPLRNFDDVVKSVQNVRKNQGKKLSENKDPSGKYVLYVDGLEKLKINSTVSLVQIDNVHGDGMGGSSGMPLFNYKGQLLGVYLFQANDQGFGIHVETIRSFVQQHLKDVSLSGCSSAST